MAQKSKNLYETHDLSDQNEIREELRKRSHRTHPNPQEFDQIGYIPYHTEFLEYT